MPLDVGACDADGDFNGEMADVGGTSLGVVLPFGAALSIVDRCTLKVRACDLDGDTDGEMVRSG